MISPDKKSFEIAKAFSRCLESEDKSSVENYTREEIEIALLQLIKDSNCTYYAAMQVRREELRETEDYKREKRAKWRHRIVLFIAGTTLGLILLLLRLIFYP